MVPAGIILNPASIPRMGGIPRTGNRWWETNEWRWPRGEDRNV